MPPSPLWLAAPLSFVRLLGLVSAVAALGPAFAAGEELPFLVGADVSALSTLEKHGAVYRYEGRKADGMSILRAEGFNCFRLRLFVAPNGTDVVTNNLEYTLALAKRVRAMKAAFLLDIHYSDTWADPSRQDKPAAWAKLDYEALRTQVRAYTAEVLRRFAAEGVKPHLVQLGNEITNGLLWPEGRVDFGRGDADPEAWAQLGGLLRAAADGVADAFPGEARPVTVLHIESPDQYQRARWFCRHALAAGVPFDVIGTSYYPDWHGDLSGLKQCLNGLAAEFKKPVMVVETAYPWFPDEHWKDRPHMDWPMTKDGQRRFLAEVLAAVRAVPGGLGRGVFYWYPEAVPVKDMPVWVGGSCALFDRNGEVLPAAGFSRPASN